MSNEIKEDNKSKFRPEMTFGRNEQTERTIIIEDILMETKDEKDDSNLTNVNDYERCTNVLIFQEGTTEDLNLRYGLTKPLLFFRGEPYVSICPNCIINIII